MFQMMKECKDEFLYFGKYLFKFWALVLRIRENTIFYDKDNNNMLLVLKYNVKITTLFYSKKLLKIDTIFICLKYTLVFILSVLVFF